MKQFIALCLITLAGYVMYGAWIAFFVAGRLADRLVGQDLALRLQTTAVNWFGYRLRVLFRETPSTPEAGVPPFGRAPGECANTL